MAVPTYAARAAAIPERYLRPHLPEPDYTRPLLELTAAQRRSILGRLTVLYGREKAAAAFPEIERLMKVYYAYKTPEMLADDATFDPRARFDERDVVLITYGDLIISPGRSPLRALGELLETFMKGSINTVHLLPFFPYSSDRGFAIVDYEDVDPRLGTWQEVERLNRRFRLMFDGVFNHVSPKSRWFQRFLNGRPGFEEYFVAFNTRDAIGSDHLKLILRPRTSDLLTRFQSISGPRWVWTTFGPDQVDLNFKNPRVLQRVVEVLLYYVRRGADLVRLDAITYIWRELGTRCVHLRETHALVQLFRAVLDAVAPQVALVTETNVPHAENVSYFGNGTDEAQMVYNFALPPLALHTFHTGSCRLLSQWARSLEEFPETVTFLNFLDSHDGVGLMGARGILSEEETGALVARAEAHGGLVSYRDTGDGSRGAYELNVTWYSALNREDAGEGVELQVSRFIASRAVALVLRGVPGIYLPSLFGAKNDTAAVLAGAEPRSINRKTIDEQALYALLGDRRSWAHRVATRFRRLVRRRIRTPAFHPNGEQRILDAGEAVFAVRRTSPGGRQRVVALTNVTALPQSVVLPAEALGGAAGQWRDVITSRRLRGQPGGLEAALRAYEVLWLTPEG
ncbi:MAG TPA: sugar phosphorylase [Vicinamibacteria bacterium]|nr:sugar phosphorylase [Vicinamibacteria bacterium]